jgi:hypothetical protein
MFYGLNGIMAEDYAAWTWDGAAFRKIFSAHCAGADYPTCALPLWASMAPGNEVIGVVPANRGQPARTMRWNGAGWTALAVATPDYPVNLTFDPSSNRTVAVCGNPRTTCTFDGTSWASSALPPELQDIALEFAGATTQLPGQPVVLWGGRPGYSPTWSYSSGTWRRLSG